MAEARGFYRSHKYNARQRPGLPPRIYSNNAVSPIKFYLMSMSQPGDLGGLVSIMIDFVVLIWGLVNSMVVTSPFLSVRAILIGSCSFLSTVSCSCLNSKLPLVSVRGISLRMTRFSSVEGSTVTVKLLAISSTLRPMGRGTGPLRETASPGLASGARTFCW